MFAVLSVESIPDHLRGYISRFLTQIHTGLYAGVVTRRVTDGLWTQVKDNIGDGSAALIVSHSDHETGFELLLRQSRTHRVADFDGLQLPVTLSDFDR